MNYPITDFSGACGEGTQKGSPMSVTPTSIWGLPLNGRASVNGNIDLSTCLKANGGGCVYGITLTYSGGAYRYLLNVDAQGPSGFGSGAMYLAFTDGEPDTYYLSVDSSIRSVHSVRYNSKNPDIKKIWWSNYSFKV